MKKFTLSFFCLFIITLVCAQITPTAFFAQFPDSGRFANGVAKTIKEGEWVEYSIDSSMAGGKAYFGNSGNSMTFGIDFIKKKGNYSNNKKDGIWTEFHSSNYGTSVSWERWSTTTFKNGIKEGEEIIYQGYGEDQKPLIIRHFQSGIENGDELVYNSNFPYLLLASYTVSNGQYNGSYKYYHSNGTLWTEIIYENGKEMEVLYNNDRNGKPQEKGTLKNGNGTIIHYDENGNQTEILNFKNGVEIKL
jgi:antitoxin component YwqK of YwqJK toxin-antitoxin module